MIWGRPQDRSLGDKYKVASRQDSEIRLVPPPESLGNHKKLQSNEVPGYRVILKGHGTMTEERRQE